MTHGTNKFVLHRDFEDGYRWWLRSDTGETLAASSTGHPSKGGSEANIRAFMANHHPGADPGRDG